jgi:apolipoprotein D and lipocalin family protein
LPVVGHVDWSRYAGLWYEVARLPNSFQRKCVANVTADYSALANGNIQVTNRCERDGHGIDAAIGEARQVAGDVGKLQVRFAPKWLAWVPAVWGDYWVIALDDDYRTALVGTPDRQYLWLLSRVPQRTSADIDEWLQKAAALGFDAQRVMRTPQTMENPPVAAPPPAPSPEPLPQPVPEPAADPTAGSS